LVELSVQLRLIWVDDAAVATRFEVALSEAAAFDRLHHLMAASSQAY
jgi:hypothetical protein